MHDCTVYWALHVHTTFDDINYISRSQQCQRFLSENFTFSLVWNFIGLLSTSSRSWMYHYYWCHIYSWEKIDAVSLFHKDLNVGFFADTLRVEFFQTLHETSTSFEVFQECLRYCQGTECLKCSSHNLTPERSCYFDSH